MVFEVENKLRPQDLRRFVGMQLPHFKEIFLEYTLYGGIGALVVKG